MQIEHNTVNTFTPDDILIEHPPVRTKFNISMEKKIEKLLEESERQGWDFNQFVTATLEVLTILHHRNKLRRTGRVTKKLPQRKRASNPAAGVRITGSRF